jgi:hypothetical protein
MTVDDGPPLRGKTLETVLVAACVLGGIGLVAAADLAGIPVLRWIGAGLVIAGGVAIALTSRW